MCVCVGGGGGAEQQEASEKLTRIVADADQKALEMCYYNCKEISGELCSQLHDTGLLLELVTFHITYHIRCHRVKIALLASLNFPSLVETARKLKSLRFGRGIRMDPVYFAHVILLICKWTNAMQSYVFAGNQ